MGLINFFKPLSIFLSPAPLISIANINNFFLWNFLGYAGNASRGCWVRSKSAASVLCSPLLQQNGSLYTDFRLCWLFTAEVVSSNPAGYPFKKGCLAMQHLPKIRWTFTELPKFRAPGSKTVASLTIKLSPVQDHLGRPECILKIRLLSLWHKLN